MTLYKHHTIPYHTTRHPCSSPPPISSPLSIYTQSVLPLLTSRSPRPLHIYPIPYLATQLVLHIDDLSILFPKKLAVLILFQNNLFRFFLTERGCIVLIQLWVRGGDIHWYIFMSQDPSVIQLQVGRRVDRSRYIPYQGRLRKEDHLHFEREHHSTYSKTPV